MTDLRDPARSKGERFWSIALTVGLVFCFLYSFFTEEYVRALIFAVILAADQITDAIDTGFGDARRAAERRALSRWLS